MKETLSKERKAGIEEGYIPKWYTTQGWQMFKSAYSVNDEEAVVGRFMAIAKTLSKYMPNSERYQKVFFNMMWDGVLSPASPVLANVGTTRGMPVSCSGQYVDDSVVSFFDNIKTTALLSKNGFGTSANLSSIRPRGEKISNGGKSNGAVPIAELFFQTANTISQGGNRRGAVAVYLDIEHGDFDELCDLILHHPDGKNVGWIIRDSFSAKLQAEDEESNRRYTKMLFTKLVTGKGYMFFPDKVNRHRPEAYVNNGLEVNASNLCSEITLHSSVEYDFSCILSSLNLVHYDRLMTGDDIFNATIFLDCLCSYFIEVSEGVEGMEKVRNFTIKGRAIGLGVMGWHTYLQENRIPYVSLEAHMKDIAFFKRLQSESLRASKYLAEIHGEPEWCKGLGIRNTHRTALAPTKSTSILMGGVSESMFPDPGMVYDSDSSKGLLRRITPGFYELMKEREVYNEKTLNRIATHNGSVQNEDWLTDDEKLVFLTAYEIDNEIIRNRTSIRQKHICQGQSLNFYLPEDGCEDKISELISKCITDENIFSQYYAYSKSGVTVKDECISCQG